MNHPTEGPDYFHDYPSRKCAVSCKCDCHGYDLGPCRDCAMPAVRTAPPERSETHNLGTSEQTPRECGTPAPAKPAGGVRVHLHRGVWNEDFRCGCPTETREAVAILYIIPDPPSGREEKVGTPKDYDPNPQYAPPPPRVAQERCAKCGSPRVSLDHQNSMGHAFVPPAPSAQQEERCRYTWTNESDQSRCGYKRDDHVMDGGRSVVCGHAFVPPSAVEEKK